MLRPFDTNVLGHALLRMKHEMRAWMLVAGIRSIVNLSIHQLGPARRTERLAVHGPASTRFRRIDQNPRRLRVAAGQGRAVGQRPSRPGPGRDRKCLNRFSTGSAERKAATVGNVPLEKRGRARLKKLLDAIPVSWPFRPKANFIHRADHQRQRRQGNRLV